VIRFSRSACPALECCRDLADIYSAGERLLDEVTGCVGGNLGGQAAQVQEAEGDAQGEDLV
jgi:hypothetical protein